jgi:hypothetical protein
VEVIVLLAQALQQITTRLVDPDLKFAGLALANRYPGSHGLTPARFA